MDAGPVTRMARDERVKLFPERFTTGTYSGSPRDFAWYETLKTKPRGGEDVLDYWYSTDPEESEYLDEGFQAHCDQRLERLKQEGWDPRVQHAWCIGQSHLDLAWMWHFRQGVAKAETTFGKAHGHFKLFAPFTFTGSQPAQYQWVKLHDPVTWANVVDDVARRRHEPQGGCWCEADGRMPSGEAWVRQRLYGQLFYARNFGCLANVAWFPDSFGYANNLPQIFAKSGSTGFYTAKLTSNKQTKWPFWSWRWQAPDGSCLTSHLSGCHNKIGPFGGYDVPQLDSPVRESYVKANRLVKPGTSLVVTYEMHEPENREELSDEEVPLLGVFFGEGDGGHGPQGVEVATCRAMVERGVASWCTTKEFYEKLEAWKDRLPVWNDELYYQFHRGSLTTQTAMKRMNRRFEWGLPAVEALHVITTLLEPGAVMAPFERFYTGEHDMTPATTNPIEQVWQNVLLMQFHDVVTGTSIPEVYDECFEFWTQDKPLVAALERACMEVLARHHGLAGPGAALRVTLPAPAGGHASIQLVPVLVASVAGAGTRQLVEIPVDQVPGKLPFAAIVPGADPVAVPVQLAAPEPAGHPIDKRGPRWIVLLDTAAWSSSACWLACVDGEPGEPGPCNEMLAALHREIFPGGRRAARVARDGNRLVLDGGETTVAIDTATGAVTSIASQGREQLSGPGRLRAFLDKPHREPCWNLMVGWWEHELDVVSCLGVDVVESGPVRWTARARFSLGKGSTATVDTSVVPGLDGAGTFIGLDFHEHETLVKYTLPLADPGTWSYAESCYAVSKRRNKPVANHDVPRWEKWMHTFVAMERDDRSGGLAVLNDGKYGFDTLEGCVAISVVHGPEYPGTNVVAWARDEREARVKAGLGEPPTHADQGEHGTRLWILPYTGSWRDGGVAARAHAFNVPPGILVLPGGDGDTCTLQELDRKLAGRLASAGLPVSWVRVSDPRVEVTVLKRGEILPPFMDSRHGATPGIVIRVVNASDEPVQASIQLNPCIWPRGTGVIETTLLEQALPATPAPSWSTDVPGDGEAWPAIHARFAPHDIKTFKLVPPGA